MVKRRSADNYEYDEQHYAERRNLGAWRQPTSCPQQHCADRHAQSQQQPDKCELDYPTVVVPAVSEGQITTNLRHQTLQVELLVDSQHQERDGQH